MGGVRVDSVSLDDLNVGGTGGFEWSGALVAGKRTGDAPAPLFRSSSDLEAATGIEPVYRASQNVMGRLWDPTASSPTGLTSVSVQAVNPRRRPFAVGYGTNYGAKHRMGQRIPCLARALRSSGDHRAACPMTGVKVRCAGIAATMSDPRL